MTKETAAQKRRRKDVELANEINDKLMELKKLRELAQQRGLTVHVRVDPYSGYSSLSVRRGFKNGRMDLIADFHRKDA